MVTAGVQNIRVVCAAAVARGVPARKLLAAVELEPRSLLDADGRIPVASALRVWHVASELCADPGFGLSAVDHLRPDYFGLLGYALHAGATVGEALRRLARYFHVVDSRVALELVEDGRHVHVQLSIDNRGATADDLRHPVECLLAGLLLVEQRATGAPLRPVSVAFRHAAPDDVSGHVRAFGVLPLFEQPRSELVLPASALALHHLAPDASLNALAERHVRRLIEEQPASETFAVRTRRALLEELRHGEPALARIAARLRTSERTLQRRLLGEGTTLLSLLDEIRRAVALRHLAETKESIAEIAFLLGFSEVRAFHRAFKRWTGSTPAAYRHSAVAAGGVAAGAAPPSPAPSAGPAMPAPVAEPSPEIAPVADAPPGAADL
jgi:AraC-like DNA-binding protein